MGITGYGDLNSIQLDVLQEIGNIGSGNAVTSLAQLLNKRVDIGVPKVRILDYTEVAGALGGPENMVVGILLSLAGDVTGMMMYLMEKDFAHMTLNALLGRSFEEFGEIDELSFSALQEVSNIMSASYVNAVAQLTGLNINISVPSLCVDMVGAILSVPAIHCANISDKIIFIEDNFNTLEQGSTSHMLMIPDIESLTKMMNNLGIEL